MTLDPLEDVEKGVNNKLSVAMEEVKRAAAQRCTSTCSN